MAKALKATLTIQGCYLRALKRSAGLALSPKAAIPQTNPLWSSIAGKPASS